MAENQPENKYRMTTELSNFAARLREIILSFSNVGDDVRSLILQNRQSATPLRACSREIGVGNRQLSEPPHQPSSDYGTAGVGCYKNEFNALALELFALQFKHNTAYRKICERRGLTPELVEHWTQIPAVPAAAFKELDLTCLAPAERTAVFHSSGTTEQKPSRHYHSAESLNVYEASLLPWFLENVLPDLRFTTPTLVACSRFIGVDDLRLVCLTPPSEQAPHSSLVHMFETVRQKLGGAESVFVGYMADTEARRWGERPREPQTDMHDGSSVASPHQTAVMERGSWTLNFDAVLKTLREAIEQNRLLILLGTAFSFVHLLDWLAERSLSFQLPSGSRVMETGGYKNRSRSVPKTDLHQLITERLGVPSSHIICEYGMSELSSQAYDLGALASRRRVSSLCSEQDAGVTPAFPGLDTRHFRFPPWARAQIISPETGREVADGETGLIRVFDLANVFSVMAIQTEDLGIRRGEHFELIGRAALAEPRGCSLMAHSVLSILRSRTTAEDGRIPHSAIK